MCRKRRSTARSRHDKAEQSLELTWHVADQELAPDPITGLIPYPKLLDPAPVDPEAAVAQPGDPAVQEIKTGRHSRSGRHRHHAPHHVHVHSRSMWYSRLEDAPAGSQPEPGLQDAPPGSSTGPGCSSSSCAADHGTCDPAKQAADQASPPQCPAPGMTASAPAEPASPRASRKGRHHKRMLRLPDLLHGRRRSSRRRPDEDADPPGNGDPTANASGPPAASPVPLPPPGSVQIPWWKLQLPADPNARQHCMQDTALPASTGGPQDTALPASTGGPQRSNPSCRPTDQDQDSAAAPELRVSMAGLRLEAPAGQQAAHGVQVLQAVRADVAGRQFECPVCLDQGGVVAFGCGHTVCESCAQELMRAGLPTCPKCRAPVKQRLRVYL